MNDNILIIKSGRLGDLLQLTPLIRALKQQVRGVYLLVNEPFRAVLAANPDLDAIITYDRARLTEELNGNGWSQAAAGFELASLVLKLREYRFTKIFNFQTEAFFAGLAEALGCETIGRKGFDRSGKSIVHGDPYLLFLAGLQCPEICQWNLVDFFLGGAGFRPVGGLNFPISAADRAAADKLMPAGAECLVAVHPGASETDRTFSADEWLTLMRSAKPDIHWVIVGSERERDLARHLAQHCGRRCLDLTGQTSLPVLAAVLERCRMLICGDTGPLHVAAAAGIMTMGLYLTVKPFQTGAYRNGAVSIDLTAAVRQPELYGRWVVALLNGDEITSIPADHAVYRCVLKPGNPAVQMPLSPVNSSSDGAAALISWILEMICFKRAGAPACPPLADLPRHDRQARRPCRDDTGMADVGRFTLALSRLGDHYMIDEHALRELIEKVHRLWNDCLTVAKE